MIIDKMKSLFLKSFFSDWLSFGVMVLLLVLFLLFTSCSGGGGNSTPTPQPAPAPVTGSAYLSWNPCTTYTDNSPVDLAGYKVYHGTAHNTYTEVITLPLVSLVSIVTPTHNSNNLLIGTHYFAVTAFDVAGTESALSVEVHKTI